MKRDSNIPEHDSSAGLLPELTSRAQHVSRYMARQLSAAYRAHKLKRPLPTQLPDWEFKSQYPSKRVLGLIREAFSDSEVPDVLRVTATLLTDPQQPFTYQLVEHAIIAGLRTRYAVDNC